MVLLPDSVDLEFSLTVSSADVDVFGVDPVVMAVIALLLLLSGTTWHFLIRLTLFIKPQGMLLSEFLQLNGKK